MISKDFRTENYIVDLLQGKWTENSNISFEISLRDFKNIKGVYDSSGIQITESSFSLHRDTSKDMWIIINLPILNSHKFPIIVENDKFTVFDLSWPPKPIRTFIRII
jgi:hypothetical protein